MHATSHLVAQLTAGPRSSRRETEISVQVSLIFISMMTLRAACLQCRVLGNCLTVRLRNPIAVGRNIGEKVSSVWSAAAPSAKNGPPAAVAVGLWSIAIGHRRQRGARISPLGQDEA
ncbi:hypothetical protein BJX68DRAFT_20064 [Aspergillus pseudodeflectus]|uniref:Uncharacterized protein n=1 Tax=Aspergillus pseudodeflectus TaxID=176178 RepID=A0ABR4KRY1_9EURO